MVVYYMCPHEQWLTVSSQEVVRVYGGTLVRRARAGHLL